MMNYQIAVLKKIVQIYECEIHAICWDKNKLTPFFPKNYKHIHFYKRSEFSKKEIYSFAKSLNPKLIYISGWQDKDYLYTARKFRKKNIPIVTGFDDKWNNSLKQIIGSFFLKTFANKLHFSHAWVAGPYQYEYAKKMGFHNDQIIFNLLSCDTEIFDIGHSHIDLKSHEYPKTFLYVGNFRNVKGFDILLKAFDIYKMKYSGKWKLVCVGSGDIQKKIVHSDITIHQFTDQNNLVKIAKKSGAFVLPSRNDQWGVVVHEFSLLGLPLLLSENVGSSPAFLIHGYNGYIFRRNSAKNLASMMSKIENLSNEELRTMGKRSVLLGNRINPEISARSLLSIVI